MHEMTAYASMKQLVDKNLHVRSCLIPFWHLESEMIFFFHFKILKEPCPGSVFQELAKSDSELREYLVRNAVSGNIIVCLNVIDASILKHFS